tara:strand:- start:2689 stop:2991 length:303 start_codon:yes stop_codon:yes gene_type:complete
MGYGNGMAGSKKMIRKPAVRQKMYSREFSTFFTNHASTSGDSRVRIGGADIVPGTISAKKGYPFCFFSSDDGSIVNRKHFLRNITSDSVSRGEHLLTFSA